MKNNPVAIFTGLAVAAAVGLGAIIYSRQPTTVAEKPPEPAVTQPATPEKPADATAEKKPEAAPAQPDQTVKTETPAPETAPAPETKAPETAPAPETAKAPEPAKQPDAKTEAAAKPTFDTVRVESDGGTLAAGQATPGADVTLKRNGEVVGKAQANADGDWVVVTEAPLPKGASELSVEQKTADSGQTVMSDQSIAVVVPATPNEKAMVALVEPGMPTQVIQKAEPTTTAEATPANPAATAETEAKSTAETAQQPAAEKPAADSTAETAQQPAAEKPAADSTAETAQQPAVEKPAADATTASGETEPPAEKAPEAAPETKTALAEPSKMEEPAAQAPATEQPSTQQPAVEQPAVEQPAVETPAAKPGAPVSLDAVDYNSTGDIVFSGSAAPGSAVRVYVDNSAVGDAAADQSGHWTFAGTQKIAPGGHSLRVDQIDAGGKVLSRVELPFVREEAERVAEMNTPETQPAQQKTAEVEQPAPEATVTAETQAPKPTTSETTEAAATADTQLAPKPETAAPATQPETEVAKAGQGEEVAKTETPSVTPTEQPAATEQPATKIEEPAVAAQGEATTQADTTQQAATAEPAQIEEKSTAAEGAAIATNEQAQPAQSKKGRIIIQPGNNLWKLSRVIYGKGISYTVIYEANKGQIRDPDLIYPGQIFATPNAVPPETIDPKRKKPLSAEEGGTTVQ
ncbi:MAG: Ig-like domain-containing protein [Hyphomicrobiales bacterium]